ncbi:ubiquitin-conjugating enzyme, variant [Coccidioides immitis H538.4]|uniref:Ubiquitin-conjugating enzyme E2 1 n=1 Tax=Coccidioides immitis H538.4 TaxID=396776 RepID=A0A0J8RJA5_COCIT|nr:ubiquitin-conjugating enzyme, variant [Coccidioides immitis H538.4]
MASNRARRIAKELADIHDDSHSQVAVEPIGGGDDLTHLKGTFQGPPGTPYEGGTYRVDIRIPNEYPFRPPVMRFDTKLWHPNVSSQTGAICLDTLGTAWSPVLTIKSALLSLQSLLSTPEPKDPQDAEVANMLLRNPKEFERVAREWAVMHAGAPRSRLAKAAAELQRRPSARKRSSRSRSKSKKSLPRMRDITRISSTVSAAWASMSQESLQLSNMLASTGWTEKITNWRRLTWEM